MKSYDQACEELFSKLRELCQNEISKTVEIDRDAAQSLQDFSNQILKIVSDTKQSHWSDIQKAKCQVSLMDELLISSVASRESLQKQIDEEKKLLKETILNISPPVREKVNIKSKSDKF